MIEQVLEDEKMLSIYRLDDETNISQDIDLAILKALLKGMGHRLVKECFMLFSYSFIRL